MNNNIEGQEN